MTPADTIGAMGKVYDAIDGRLPAFLLAQKVFFVATAPSGADGQVNLSPKGLTGCFAILGGRRVAYLDFTGSGAETIAHLRENGRIALMFCAFEGPPKIVRLHGRGRVVRPGDDDFAELFAAFPDAPDTHGLRSIIDVAVTRISDSCGYAVPLMAYQGDRDLLQQSHSRKSAEELAAYRQTRNAVSVDGLPALTEGGGGRDKRAGQIAASGRSMPSTPASRRTPSGLSVTTADRVVTAASTTAAVTRSAVPDRASSRPAS